MLKAGAVLQIAHLLATVSSTNATSTALHASPDSALLPPAFMSGRRPDRTRALNFRSTFRECRASAAPGCGPGEDWVTMPQFFVRATPCLGGLRPFADPPPARVCAEEPGVLDLERGQNLPRRDGRPALLDLPLQPDRGE